ncbi:alpha/beta fold hydrolase [Trinickia fusca]|uniref:Alpha/beta hydrolase n=1 Tax=Trinickia fusca TaxID=2419777 RepID=A0A494XIB8_9BURK|nr:alpha/beta hydrolase [Trinickia fusca]RKP50485.1 alpha/beta hydrolase [Trinickia fusca]
MSTLHGRDSTIVRHHTITIDGIKLFYREAGALDAPVIVLLHGFPSSSRMYTGLMPLLADRYRVIAPDYPGFGHSDAPSPDAFRYTFDNLAHYTQRLLDTLELERYALYLQDYGGPIGMRLALAHPERVTALVFQNAVVHEEGLSAGWKLRREFWNDRSAHYEAARAAMLSPEVARQRHLAGVFDEARIDPDTWADEYAFLTRPGMDQIQMELVYDYRTNVAAYPQWQAWLREQQPRTLVVWGKRDPLFTTEGALAIGREVPDAEIHLLNASHFALDEQAPLIATLMRHFLM